jgi:hypothetical protein
MSGLGVKQSRNYQIVKILLSKWVPFQNKGKKIRRPFRGKERLTSSLDQKLLSSFGRVSSLSSIRGSSNLSLYSVSSFCSSFSFATTSSKSNHYESYEQEFYSVFHMKGLKFAFIRGFLKGHPSFFKKFGRGKSC